MTGRPQAMPLMVAPFCCQIGAVEARKLAGKFSCGLAELVSGHGCLLSCLPLVRRAAGVSVRMVRSLAACWSMACGPLPVSSRTDGS